MARSLAYRVATGIPFLTAGNHGVEDDDELTHAGDERNLRLLAFGNQATIEGLEHRIVPRRGAEASHVEEIAHPAASALDLALAASFAAIVVVRRNAEQGGDCRVAHLSQFRHPCDQAGGSDLGEFPARSR